MSIDLRLGDAFEGLRGLGDRSVDHIVSDPPWDQRTHKIAGRTRSLLDKGRAEALGFAPLGDEQIGELGRQFARVAKRWVLIFAADRQVETWARALEDGGARVLRLGYVERVNPAPQFSGDRPGMGGDLLIIAHARGTRPRWHGGGRAAVWRARSGAADFDGPPPHPTVKSLDLLRKLVCDFTDEGELVCDPFAGSGTTAVACKLEGRRFVGWEVDRRYHTAAMKRIEAAREQLRLVG